MTQTVEVSVIICVKNGAATIRRQLDALDAQADHPPFEVIIVDNKSTDDTRVTVQQWINQAEHKAVRCTLLSASERSSIPYARNVGASHARGRIIAFCDADDVVGPSWVSAFASAMTNDCLAGGRIEAFDPHGVYRPDASLHDLTQTPYLPHVGNGNCAITSDAFFRIGGYDESLPRYGFEDVDFSWRAQEAGIPIRYVPDAVIRFSLSDNADSVKKRFLLGQGRVLMAARYPSYDNTRYTVHSCAVEVSRLAITLAKEAVLNRHLNRRTASQIVAVSGRAVGVIRYHRLGRLPAKQTTAFRNCR